MPEEKQTTSAQNFAGNVMKYSVASYLGFVITGVALIVKGLLPSQVLGAPVTFMTYTATFMNLGILGLDQALLRFYHEPPAGAAPRQRGNSDAWMFRLLMEPSAPMPAAASRAR